MKGLIKKYAWAVDLLIKDETNTFYSFFTVIIAECIYLWNRHYSSAKYFTIISIAYILNVIICALLEVRYEGEKQGAIASSIYGIVFIALIIIGCFINIPISIALVAIPIVFTLLISARGWLLQEIADSHIGLGIFLNCLIVYLPCILFAFSVLKYMEMDLIWKITIIMLYVLVAPLICYFEDETAALTIFELATDPKETYEILKQCPELNDDN